MSTLGSERTWTRPLVFEGLKGGTEIEAGKECKEVEFVGETGDSARGIQIGGRELAGADAADHVSETSAEDIDAEFLALVPIDAGEDDLEQDLLFRPGQPATLSRLTTCLEATEAIWTARWELVRSDTVPLRKTAPFSLLTLTAWPGNSRVKTRRIPSRRSAEEPARTVMLKNSRLPPFSQMMRLVWPGTLPLTSISMGLMAAASAMSPRPTATRSTGCEQSMITDLPTPTKVHWPNPAWRERD